MVLASRRRSEWVVAVVEEPHERAIETPSRDDLGDDFDGAEQCEHAVIRVGEVGDIERQK